jgi:peptidoglycan hydrolase-like protein with peptidoglycan-binding domain
MVPVDRRDAIRLDAFNASDVPDSSKRRILSVAPHDEQVARSRAAKTDAPRLRLHRIGHEFGDRGTPLHRGLDIGSRKAQFAAGRRVAPTDKRGTPRRRTKVKLGVDPDGAFGPKSVAALKAWQPLHGLRATGELDPPTLRVLFQP